MREKVGIRPDVSVLGALRFLNYKPWYALAEYVDNSIDSYLKNQDELYQAKGNSYQLIVRIDINTAEKTITIEDNAAGIKASDLGRALSMAVPPPDRTRLSEYGMGMKAASCWFAPVWVLSTKALSESVARTIKFDVDSIVLNHTEELDVQVVQQPEWEHYTKITLKNLFHPPVGKTFSKIKEQLASLYRYYLRTNQVRIILNGEELEHEDPAILNAPLHSSEKGESLEWRQEIEFECQGGRTVKGFAAIRETGSVAKAGFALFRRGRIIEGSIEQGYRPAAIFGSANGYRYQRVFGELHMEGFGVSHTKDGFQWDGCEDEFEILLYKALSSQGLPILTQAENYRKRENKSTSKGNAATNIGRTNSSSANGHGTKGSIGNTSGSSSNGAFSSLASNTPSSQHQATISFPAPITPAHIVRVTVSETAWKVYVELSSSHAHTDWLEIGDNLLPKGASAAPGERLLGVRLALTHSFSRQLLSSGGSTSTLVQLATGLAVAKTLASDGGATYTSLLLEYLSEALSSTSTAI